jgi:GrpB-like predicted nucleotidyltransferase (UPF0157 family)
MPLTSRIETYNSRWPSQFACEATRLLPVFGESLIEIHHIGSTAVPSLSAKPEIDIVVVVIKRTTEADWSAGLVNLGYRRGGNLSVGHQFYKRDISGVRTHKVHVCDAGHLQIARMVKFRDMLRQDHLLRQRYQDLKVMLERTNTFGIAEYLRKKAPFIDISLLEWCEKSAKVERPKSRPSA